MKRRSLLKGAAAVAMGAACPAWIRSAFADESCNKAVTPKRGLIAMSEGFRAAQRAGRALLVFVIPEDEGARWKPAHSFGEYLNYGTVEQLLPLAALEVVCAKMSTLRTLVPSAPAGEPLMVLVETDRSPATARALNAVLPEYKEPPQAGDLTTDWQKVQKERAAGEDDAISQRIAAIAGVLRASTIDDSAWLAAHAETARAGLSAAEIDKLSSAQLDDALLAKGAPLMLALAMRTDDDAMKASLMKLVKSQMVAKPPRGTRWATGSGCGVDIEGEPPEIVGCGMGHTSPRSRRFLYFFRRNYPGEAQTAND
jgi:hypothetical protein